MAENDQQANQTTEKRGGGERRGPGNGPGGRREGGGPRSDRGPDRGGDRDRGGRDRRFDGPPEIDLEKLINDSLYLDNQAHGVVARMRDMDSGTKSQLRRFYNAVRRACRAADAEKQHEFVMLRARLAYTIARHQLRSLDTLEKLLLQVTRKNDAKGYERFRDLFEAIVAYNE
jgi:CRISPR type III-A-associated protein Csm2